MILLDVDLNYSFTISISVHCTPYSVYTVFDRNGQRTDLTGWWRSDVESVGAGIVVGTVVDVGTGIVVVAYGYW